VSRFELPEKRENLRQRREPLPFRRQSLHRIHPPVLIWRLPAARCWRWRERY